MEHLGAKQHALAMELLRSAHSPDGGDLAVGAVEVERVGGNWRPAHRPTATATGCGCSATRTATRRGAGGSTATTWPYTSSWRPAARRSRRTSSAPNRPSYRPGRTPAAGSSAPRRTWPASWPTGLDPDQRALGISADVAPDDILTRADPVADPTLLPEGIGRDLLRPAQQEVLDRLVRRYLDRAPAPYARACWRDAEAAGLDRIRFAWAGPTAPGEGHYYCVRAPEFLIEYDNTQDDANHAHSVWRHLRDDWGVDLLRDHYARSHSGELRRATPRSRPRGPRRR